MHKLLFCDCYNTKKTIKKIDLRTMTLIQTQPSLFDILVKNFFDTTTKFQSVYETKINYPMNIYDNENGLYFEIACTGIDKKNIDINIDNDILHIKYDNGYHCGSETPQNVGEYSNHKNNYLQKCITHKSFDYGYKIPTKYNIEKVEATMNNGLLTIFIPFSDTLHQIKQIEIK